MFEKYINLPLRDKNDGIYIRDNEGNIVAMVASRSESRIEEMISVINDDSSKGYGNKDWQYYRPGDNANGHTVNKPSLRSKSDSDIIILRGWGYLVSPYMCALSGQDACEVQDEFGKYIENKLNGIQK